MPDGVTAQLDVRSLPSTERLGRGGKGRRDSEVVKQPILIQAEQVLLVANHRVAERAVEQTDVLQCERNGLGRDFVGYTVDHERCRENHAYVERWGGEE